MKASKTKPLCNSNSSALYKMAFASLQQGKLDLAIAGLAQVCRQRGASALEHLTYAEALRRANRQKEALAAAKRAVAVDPTFGPGWETLAVISTALGNLKEAAECLEKAVALNPKSVFALNNLGLILQTLGQFKAAEARYWQAISLAPDNLEVKINFATHQGLSGNAQSALSLVEEVLQQDPSNIKALLLGTLLALEANNHDLALCWTEKVLALAPGNPKALYFKGRALQGLDRPQDALAAFDLAEPMTPEPAAVLTSKASLLAELGEKEAAFEAIQKAILKDPNFSPAWHYRANFTRYKAGDPDLATMEALFAKPGLSHLDKINLSFALGKAYLEIDDGERAFSRLEIGSALKRGMMNYSPEAERQRFGQIAASFSKTLIDQFDGSGHPSNRPIFVFGMPRSGTTLIEQILATHPLVQGLGELLHLPKIAGAPRFMEGVPEFLPAQFAEAGRQYVELAAAKASPNVKLVDKLPSNFYFAGLIALCLPGAKMIHSRRDPLDTCLSCYSILFERGNEYTYDLTELGQFYRLYLALMEHWRQILPKGKIFEVDYESLVANPEPEVRRLLDFCELPWDSSCLRFYETQRRVTTASLNQVRQPMYQSSVGRAEKFRPWLGKLEAALQKTVRI